MGTSDRQPNPLPDSDNAGDDRPDRREARLERGDEHMPGLGFYDGLQVPRAESSIAGSLVKQIASYGFWVAVAGMGSSSRSSCHFF